MAKQTGKKSTIDRNQNKNGSRSKYDRTSKQSKFCKDQGTISDPSNSTNGARSHTSYDDVRSNDISWYDKTGVQYTDANRIPFNVIAGAPLPNQYIDSHATLGDYVQSALADESPEAIPGVMTIKFAPSIGYSADSQSAVNRAFTTIYGDIASKTTGAMQFQQADIAMLVTSMCSIAAMIGAAKRAVETCQLYNGRNYYYPRALLRAQGFKPSSVIGKQDEIRRWLNDLILQFNNFKIPDFVDVFKRQYGLCHNVYADSDSVYAQLYIFRPEGYYKYVDTESKCEFTVIEWDDQSGPDTGDYGLDINNFLQDIQDALLMWRNSSDLPLICGAIQRAYADSQLIALEQIDVNSMLIPVYDRNMIWQINNMKTVPVDYESLVIKQDPVNNTLIHEPAVKLTDGYFKWFAMACEHTYEILNSFDGDTSPEFTMEATRLIPYVSTTFEGLITSGGTELPVGVVVWQFATTSDGLSLVCTTGQTLIYGPPGDTEGMLKALAAMSRFRHGPRVTIAFTESGWDKPAQFSVNNFGDLDTYTTIDFAQLSGLTEVALLSLYWVNTFKTKI